jgi:hypothetical protein
LGREGLGWWGLTMWRMDVGIFAADKRNDRQGPRKSGSWVEFACQLTDRSAFI